MKTGLWKRMLGALALMSAAGLAGAGVAGFSRVFALPADGVLAVVNTQKNAVWRPCVVAVSFETAAARTVTVSRVAGTLEYPISVQAATARVYVYEFEAGYWSGLSNGVKVTVSPAEAGTVEVVYE